jgi:hypothetical protein
MSDKPWLDKAQPADFLRGITDHAPDAERTALGYAGIVAGYLLYKGKKKKK